MNRATKAIALLAAIGILAGCSATPDETSTMTVKPGAILPQAELAPLVADLQQKAATTPSLDRLGEGLVAPTNRWYTGLVLGGEQSQPVFPLPLGFQLTGSGYGFGLPQVTSAPGAVTAPYRQQVSVDLGADQQQVTAYDDVSVTVSNSRGGESLGRVTIARGSPVVSYVADAASDIQLSVPVESAGDGFYVATVDDVSFGLVTSGSVEGSTVTLASGDTANWFVSPDGVDAASLAQYAAPAITGVTTAWKGSTTTLGYETESGDPTLIGVLPHQLPGLAAPTRCDLGSFATVLGELRLCSGTSLRWSVDAVEPSSSLDLGSLSQGEKDELRTQLGKDLASTENLPADTYFGGKALARLANLLELARALDDGEAQAAASKRLSTELLEWVDCTDRCFVYDPEIGGVVGQPASFGSDEFNDHHFHYGYFLYAAAVAVADDDELAAQLTPTMTLLSADLASGETNEYFPARRAFDPYSGHSWASGFAPFADGNNQESSSEAVSAWNGLALWADAIGDRGLAEQARWMLSAEADSAMAYYLDFDTSTEPFSGYDRGVVGIVWDGKLDYGTWFSTDPGAILGIQLLPMQPVADYLATDPKRILANIAEVGEGTLFPDYLLMYEALAGGEGVLDRARDLPASGIDDGNSSSYLLAWIMTHAARA